MSLVWEVPFPTQTQKLALLKLADHADDNGGSVWPSNDALSYQIGCDPRTIQRTIKELERAEIIKLTSKGGKGAGSTNRWKIDVEQLIRLAMRELVLSRVDGQLQAVENKDGKLPPSNFARVTRTLRRVTQACHAEGDTAMSPEPSFNHHLEPSGASAGARDGSRTSPAEKVGPSFKLTPDRDRPQWNAWLNFLRDESKDGLIRAAEIAGEITVASKWPNPERGLQGFLAPRRENNTARITGERE